MFPLHEDFLSLDGALHRERITFGSVAELHGPRASADVKPLSRLGNRGLADPECVHPVLDVNLTTVQECRGLEREYKSTFLCWCFADCALHAAPFCF